MPDIKYTASFQRSTPGIQKTNVKVEGIKRHPNGSQVIDPVTNRPVKETIFEMKDVEAPNGWSQHAIEIAASKYFVKARVPNERGHEYSVYSMVARVAGAIADAGFKAGYFSSESKSAFENDLNEILLSQRAAFNSPVWFNVGLYHSYGITGNGVNYAWVEPTLSHGNYNDGAEGSVQKITEYYSRPQASACFIQPVGDSLEDIFKLLAAESRVFKGGSGTGTNFSSLRSRFEKLAGGGVSSGLISFLNVFDKGAGAIKSGGTTRRAAKMVIVEADHPEIFDFVNWKAKEEAKAKILIDGGMDPDFNGEAYQTISGQNANNSVRVNDAFMKAVEADGDWSTTYRTNGQVHETFKARKLWDAIAQAAWQCADPGLQYDDEIQRWNTVPKTGRINATNPCSEFLHVDNSACNLASINLLKFLREDGSFDLDGYRATIRCLIIAMDILVDLSSYPTEEIAEMSHKLRPLGLGYANLGAFLMALGIPYDSQPARDLAGLLTSCMSGEAYQVSGEIAEARGPFEFFNVNREDMLRVIRQHSAAHDKLCATTLLTGGTAQVIARATQDAWAGAFLMGQRFGYRNSQISLLAPTGTISFLMGCDTTGVEPDFALVKHKRLAGGGDMLIVNETVDRALFRLGYPDFTRASILAHIRNTGSPKGANGFQPEHLPIFDCAMPAGEDGTCISPRGHLLMVAAVQPFLSGAVSKTINVPNSATVADFQALYLEGWKLGVKAISLYRDGCKLSQPLNVAKTEKEEPKALTPLGQMMEIAEDVLNKRAFESKNEADVLRRELAEAKQEIARLNAIIAKKDAEEAAAIPVLKRQRLPIRRQGLTHELKIGGQKLYLRTGEYADGRLGEVFLDMHKQGSMMRALVGNFAIAVSIGLQYGVPLDEYVDVFTFTRFEPSGVTNHPNVRSATSLIDLIFRVLGLEYLKREDLAQVKPSQTNGHAKNVVVLEVGEPAHKTNGTPAIALDAGGRATSASSLDVHDSQTAHEIRALRATLEKSISPSGGLAKMQSDAPSCPSCGELTVRNGSCYRCPNCGESLGCS